MVKQKRWTERTFPLGTPVGLFPPILERFRGTPARIEELIASCRPPSILTTRDNGKWSIQEHVGHLWDLEELGEKRLAEFLNRSERLTAADMSNRKTNEANHNTKTVTEILRGLREERMALVRKLDELDEEQVGYSSLHPRLKLPMRLVDWVFFMCEHDDHHIAKMRELASRLSSQ